MFGSQNTKQICRQCNPNRSCPADIPPCVGTRSPRTHRGASCVAEADRRFREDDSINVMCASLKSAGVGFTWTVAKYAFILDLWWNPQSIRQAEDRLYRIGQDSPVLIKRIYSEDTIDEAIIELLKRKEKLFDAIVDDVSLPTEDETSFDELIKLIKSKK